MKAIHYFVFVIAMLGAALFGAFLGRMESRQERAAVEGERSVEVSADTLTAVAPVPAISEPRQAVTARLPVAPPRGADNIPAPAPGDGASAAPPAADTPCAADSAEVEIPITRNVYRDSLYRAVVSGYMASLDTLEIYSRREVVTVRQPPKRWHIGVSAGFGMTPSGFQPVIAATLTYSLYSF